MKVSERHVRSERKRGKKKVSERHVRSERKRGKNNVRETCYKM